MNRIEDIEKKITEWKEAQINEDVKDKELEILEQIVKNYRASDFDYEPFYKNITQLIEILNDQQIRQQVSNVDKKVSQLTFIREYPIYVLNHGAGDFKIGSLYDKPHPIRRTNNLRRLCPESFHRENKENPWIDYAWNMYDCRGAISTNWIWCDVISNNKLRNYEELKVNTILDCGEIEIGAWCLSKILKKQPRN